MIKLVASHKRNEVLAPHQLSMVTDSLVIMYYIIRVR